jgi:hypothetical protein
MALGTPGNLGGVSTVAYIIIYSNRSILNNRRDQDSHVIRCLVLPVAQTEPSRMVERLIDCKIACDIPLKLGLPVSAVVLRSRAMLRACVPKTTVNEHGHAGTGEGDVRSHHALRESEGAVDKESQASIVQPPSDSQLGPGVAPTVRAHANADGGTSRVWIGVHGAPDAIRSACAVAPGPAPAPG